MNASHACAVMKVNSEQVLPDKIVSAIPSMATQALKAN
jgi:hypothetical protein